MLSLIINWISWQCRKNHTELVDTRKAIALLLLTLPPPLAHSGLPFPRNMWKWASMQSSGGRHNLMGWACKVAGKPSRGLYIIGGMKRVVKRLTFSCSLCRHCQMCWSRQVLRNNRINLLWKCFFCGIFVTLNIIDNQKQNGHGKKCLLACCWLLPLVPIPAHNWWCTRWGMWE